MSTPKFHQVKSATVMPVVKLEPLYMFDGVDKGPRTREEIQNLFREVVRPKGIASVKFLPGTELLVPVSSLMGYLDDLAEIFSYDVQVPVDTDVSGGYAFVEDGVYVFGVEDGATIADTIEWENSIEKLVENRRTQIRHSCNYPFEAWLENERVVLWNKRKDFQYSMLFQDYRSEVRKATEELKEFALAFVPIYALKLNVPDPYEAAMWNFSRHQEWFAEHSITLD
jgi:hypothetical protein